MGWGRALRLLSMAISSASYSSVRIAGLLCGGWLPASPGLPTRLCGRRKFDFTTVVSGESRRPRRDRAAVLKAVEPRMRAVIARRLNGLLPFPESLVTISRNAYSHVPDSTLYSEVSGIVPFFPTIAITKRVPPCTSRRRPSVRANRSAPANIQNPLRRKATS